MASLDELQQNIVSGAGTMADEDFDAMKVLARISILNIPMMTFQMFAMVPIVWKMMWLVVI